MQCPWMSQLYSMLVMTIFMHWRTRATVAGSRGWAWQPQHRRRPPCQAVPSGLLWTQTERLSDGRFPCLTQDGGEHGSGAGDVGSGAVKQQRSSGRASGSSGELTHQSPGVLPTWACRRDPDTQRPGSKADEDAGRGAQSCVNLTGSTDSPTPAAAGHLHCCSSPNDATPSSHPPGPAEIIRRKHTWEKSDSNPLTWLQGKREGIFFSWWAINCKSWKNTCNSLVGTKKERKEKVDSTVPGLTSGLSEVYVILKNDVKCNSYIQPLSSRLSFSLPSNSSSITNP